MAIVSREAVMEALFNLFSGGQTGPGGNVTGINSYSRKVILPADVARQGLKLPALMLYRLTEKQQFISDALPPRRIWPVLVVVVFKNTNRATTAGDTIINPILDSIEACLLPTNPFGTQNLGGLVQYVKIDGEIMIEPGDTDTDGLGGAVIPLNILVP